MFFKELNAIAAFDFFETTNLVHEYLELAPTDPVNEKFETLGYESKHFFANMGSFVFVIVY